MSLETYGWLVLLFPLAGTVLIALTFRVLPSKVHGYLGTLAIALSFASAIGALFALQDLSAEERQVTTVAWDYANTVGVDAQLSLLLDPLSVFMALVVSGVSTLIHLYSISYMASDRGYTRFFAYLNFFVFSMLLLVLAGNFFFLIVGLGVRRRGLLPADQLLVPAHDRHRRGHQGVRHQRGRRRRPRARHVLPLQADGLARLPAGVRERGRVLPERRRRRRRLPAAAGRRVREVRAGAAAHLAPGRDGGPDTGLRPDPRRHDGDRGRLPDRAHAPVLRAGAGRSGRRRDHRLRDAADRRDHRPGRDRPQARDRVLDHVADRLHGHGGLLVRVCLGTVPPDDPRVLQGPAVHGGRLGDLRDGRRAEPRQDGRLPAGDALHLRLHGDRRPLADGRAAVRRLLLQGRDPRVHARARRLAHRARRARLRRVVPDRRLHVADDLPRVLRTAGRAGARARGRAPPPRARAPQPGVRRGGGHRRRLPRPGPPHRRARVEHEGRDGACSRSARRSPASCRSRR